jgi:DNA-binding Xre family transcriptional regulator
MSTIDFAAYIQKRLGALELSTCAAAERSGISRQTWHKLKQAEVQEAKVSTLIRVANTLQTTPSHLFDILFSTSPHGTQGGIPPPP